MKKKNNMSTFSSKRRTTTSTQAAQDGGPSEEYQEAGPSNFPENLPANPPANPSANPLANRSDNSPDNIEGPSGFESAAQNVRRISTARTSNPALVSFQQSQAFIRGVAVKCKISNDQAAVGIAILIQKGASAKRANADIYAVVDGTTLTLGMLREVQSKLPDNIRSFTLRQLGRSHATFIYQICSAYNIPGNLSTKIHRNMDMVGFGDNISWLSDFQMDNPDCPPASRELLRNHYLELFPNKKIIK